MHDAPLVLLTCSFCSSLAEFSADFQILGASSVIFDDDVINRPRFLAQCLSRKLGVCGKI